MVVPSVLDDEHLASANYTNTVGTWQWSEASRQKDATVNPVHPWVPRSSWEGPMQGKGLQSVAD